VGGFVISPLQSQEGVKGLLIEFQPHPQQAGIAAVRIVLPELEARDFHLKLGTALTFPLSNPTGQSGAKN